jgi:hypothetical protein
VIAPLGQAFVVVLNLEPIMPAPHDVIVLSIGILYGTQAETSAFCAEALPAIQRPNSKRIFPTIFKEAPYKFEVDRKPARKGPEIALLQYKVTFAKAAA